jgi:acetyl esterase/lipase
MNKAPLYKRGQRKIRRLNFEPLETRALLSRAVILSQEPLAAKWLVSQREATIAFRSGSSLNVLREGSTTRQRNLSYESDTGAIQQLDLYLPSGEAPASGWPVVMAIHGGGWRRYSKDGYGRKSSVLTKAGFAVVAPNYTLSKPGNPSWPDNLQDLRGAARWTVSNADRYNLDVARIATMGESAGGHLALMLGLDQTPATGAQPGFSIRAIADFYGPTDLYRLYHDSRGAASAVTGLLGGNPDQNPSGYKMASPLRYVTLNAPAVLIMHGLSDTLVPVSQARELARALAGHGVPYQINLLPRVGHGFSLSGEVLAATVSFLKSALA